MMTKRIPFTEWLRGVDHEVERQVGCSLSDLPDMDFTSMWEDDVKPKSAARRAIRNTSE
jgi:hypothetical protein